MTEISNWLDEDKKWVWHPFSTLKSPCLPVESGEGAYLFTPEGKKIFDGISSWWVNLHGHANPYLAQKLAEQALKLEQVIFAGFAHEPAARIASRLVPLAGSQFSKMFFSDNGSTAVEVALKLCLQYFFNQGKEKTNFIAFEGAYHGDTFGAMSVGARGVFNAPFEKLFFNVHFIPLPTEENFESVKKQFLSFCQNSDTAGFIFEPLVQGSAGMRMYSPAHLEALIKIAKANNILCIADEVMTGFGRTGKMFACQYFEEKVDLMCLSKGITGGFMPFGATLISEEITQSFLHEPFHRSFLHGHSYTGSPLASALANASLDLLLSENCQNQIQEIAECHANFLLEIAHLPAVKDVRHLGTILAIELQTDEQSNYFNSKRGDIYSYFLEKNILLRPLGNVIYILPPYCTSKADLNIVYQEIKTFLSL
jgi:adenosylmethionine-8-amino-7-oxononanoate aminotransferase